MGESVGLAIDLIWRTWMLTRYLLVALVLSLPAATSAWEESFPAVAGTWNEQQVLDFILARSPILKGYQVVTKEYTPSKPMQRVLEHTSVFARVSPSDLGGTQTTASSDNFLVSAGTTVGVQLSIPLASRKEEREHALKALDEIKAVEQLRTMVLQDLGVLRQHEADYQATQLRIALWKDKSGWAQERVKVGYDDVSGLWDVAQKLNEEKTNLGKLSLAITSQQHRVAAYAGEAWQELLDMLRADKDPKKGDSMAQLPEAQLPELAP
jgi:hypothetical protein